jgi:hypothetical protein
MPDSTVVACGDPRCGGHVIYEPMSVGMALSRQLAGAVDLADEFEMLADACGHCLAAGRPPNQQMIDNARAALRVFRGQ